jgi:hypothetical protein
MKRISGVVVVLAASAAGAFGATGVSSASSRCQAGFTESRSATDIRVTGDTCANARKVAEAASAVAPIGCIKVLDRKTGRLGFRTPCVVRGYRCTAVGVRKNRTLHVTCTRPSRQVRFSY